MTATRDWTLPGPRIWNGLSFPSTTPSKPNQSTHLVLSVMSWLFVTPWTIGPQAPLSMGFSRQEYWSGLPVPPKGTYYLPILQMQKLKVKEVSCPRSTRTWILAGCLQSAEGLCWSACFPKGISTVLLYFRSYWLAGSTLGLHPPLLLLSKGRAEKTW